MIQGHGGNLFKIAANIGCRPEDIVDFSSNMNPIGPPTSLVHFLRESLYRITFLPDPEARPAIQAYTRYHDIPYEQVLAGNGTTQLIYALPKVLASTKALIVSPTYSDYADACRMHRVPYKCLYAPESNNFKLQIEEMTQALAEVDTVFICNPNNPTGQMIPEGSIGHLSREFPQTRFVVDESYLPFVDSPKRKSLVADRRDNVLVLHSLSKIFRIPGLRIGFLVAAQETIERFKAFQKPWSVNSLAQAAVEYLMTHSDLAEGFIAKTRQLVKRERAIFTDRIKRESKITTIPSDTVFILARLPEGQFASDLKSRLLNQKILIRDCSNFDGLNKGYFRVSLKSNEINRNLVENLIQIFPCDKIQKRTVASRSVPSIGQANDC